MDWKVALLCVALVGCGGGGDSGSTTTPAAPTPPAATPPAATPPSPVVSFGNGVRLVGAGLPHGRYRSVNGPTASCYWARLRDTTGSGASIIANSIGAGPRVVEILASDYAFESSSCAQWSQVVGPVTNAPAAPFADGIYIVGIDIQFGSWRANGSGSDCYWARLRNLTGLDDLIDNYFGSAVVTVTILSTDVGFASSGCGSWTRVP